MARSNGDKNMTEEARQDGGPIKWLVRFVFCKLLNCHDFFLVQNFTSYSRRIGCYRCKQTFGMNDDVRAVLPWDNDFANMYRTLGHTVKEPDFSKRT